MAMLPAVYFVSAEIVLIGDVMESCSQASLSSWDVIVRALQQ